MNGNSFKSVNTFSKGMNMDIDKSIVSKDQYLYAENFRLVTDQGQSSGTLENIVGNTLLTANIPSYFRIVGYCNIRDELYLFLTSPSAGQNAIYKIIFNSDKTAVTSSTQIYNDSGSTEKLGFISNNLIKAVGRYESSTVKKLYWVDGINNIRFANVGQTISGLPVNKFDIIPNFSPGNISFQSFGSGNLTAGKVQYAYQLYDLYGSETLFSQPSSLISVSGTSGQTGSNKTFKGSNKDENTGKSVKIAITPQSGFNRIRVVSIKYDTINSLPKINIVADQSIPTNTVTMYFNDIGSDYLGEYTYEEFAIVGRNIFSASEIESKDNYLFVGNITQNDWDIDFDARAYRFANSSGYKRATVFGSTLNDQLDVTTSNWTTVPANHDCINWWKNYIDNDDYVKVTPVYNFAYQSDCTTLGGEGPNVKYSFKRTPLVISSTGTSHNEDYCNNTDYSNANVESTLTGYHRDEIYRFGVVFFNKKGQQSTVKWIGDIRFPHYNDVDAINAEYFETVAPIAPSNLEIKARILGISFTIKTQTALSQGAVSFKFVRVRREKDDRTIQAQGLVGTALLYTRESVRTYRLPHKVSMGAPSGVTKEPKILEFISPEINFNKNLSHVVGDKVQVVMNPNTIKYWSNIAGTEVLTDEPTGNNYSIVTKLISLGKLIDKQPSINITNMTIVNPLMKVGVTYQDGINIGSTYNFINFIERLSAGNSRYGNSGTKAILTLGTTTGITYSTPVIANYRRNVFSSQYGGNSYSARQNNVYISCSDNIPCGGTITKDVYGGDTYIAMFDYLRNILYGSIPGEWWTHNVIYFPVETSINLRYRQDDCWSKTIEDANHSRQLIREEAGVYTAGSLSYSQKTNLYEYNSVYSQNDTTIKYFPKNDSIISGTKTFDTRVMNSDRKIDNELSDSWTKFRYDNFIDVDSTYGKITDLKHYKNNLYFWQPKAFGQLSVNQRSVIQDNNVGQLVLGVGGVLDRFDYISTTGGCKDRTSVVAGLGGLYWIDLINKSVYRYNGETQSLSSMKGVDSLIKKLPLYTTTMSIYDRKYNEVLFTIGGDVNKVLSYSELLDNFNGFYTYIPSIFIDINSVNYITSNSTNNLYIHNIGNKSTFYSSTQPSKIKYIVNDDYLNTKTFDSITYQSNASNRTLTGSVYTNETFNKIKVSNDYQYSGEVVLSNNSNIIRKEREFELPVPRNAMNTANGDINNPSSLDYSRQFRERMRDKYMIVELSYHNVNNYEFTVPYITTNYRISKR